MTLHFGVVGPNATDDLATNIHEGLLALSCDSTLLGPVVSRGRSHVVTQLVELSRRSAFLGPFWERHLLDSVRNEGIDVLITVTSLRPETVKVLRKAGVRTVLWFPDSVANLGANWMFAADYHALFFKEPDLVDRLQGTLNLPIYYLPEACNPKIHRIEDVGDPDDQIVVIGNLYPTRVRLLERLAADGYSLKIYGSPSHADQHPSLARFHQRRYLRGREKSRAFRQAKCALNSLHPSEMSGMNCRLFEAAAAGAAVVSEFRPELPRLFDCETEVCSFTSYKELTDCLDSLLGSDDLSRDLGNAANARAHRDHTYEVRLQSLIEKLP